MRPTDPDPTPAPTPLRFDARALLAPHDHAVLILDDKAYLLRITRGGKLILTK